MSPTGGDPIFCHCGIDGQPYGMLLLQLVGAHSFLSKMYLYSGVSSNL